MAEEPEPGGGGEGAGQPQPGARPGLVSPEIRDREKLADLRQTLVRVGSEVAEHASRKARLPSEPPLLDDAGSATLAFPASSAQQGPAAMDTGPLSSLWSQFGVVSFPELHRVWSGEAAEHRYILSSALALARLILKICPDVLLLHCAAQGNAGWCERERSRARGE